MEAGSRPAQHGVKIMKRLIVGLLATTAMASALYAWPRSTSEVQAAQPAVTAAPVVKAEAKDEPAPVAKVEAKEEPAVRVIESARDGCGAWPYYKRSCLTAAKPAVEAPPAAPAATIVAAAKPAEPVAPGIPAGLASQVGLTAEPVPTLPIAAAIEAIPSAPAAAVAPAPTTAAAPAAARVEAPVAAEVESAEVRRAARAPQSAARAPITMQAMEAPKADVAIQTPRVTTQLPAAIPAAPAFTPRVQRPALTQAPAPRVTAAGEAPAVPAVPAAKVATRATPVETASRPAVRKAAEAEERPVVRRAFKVRSAYAEYAPVVDRDHHGQYRPGQANCDRLAGRGRH
jgi:hypothetical protein